MNKRTTVVIGAVLLTGSVLLTSGRLQDPKSHLRLAKNPSPPSAQFLQISQQVRELNRLGNEAWKVRQDYEEAERLFEEAIALNIRYASDSQLDLANLLLERGRETEAWQTYGKYLKRSHWSSSDEALTFCRYARLSESLNAQAEARWAYAQVVERYKLRRPSASQLDDKRRPPLHLSSTDPQTLKATALLLAAGQARAWDRQESSLPWLEAALDTAPHLPEVQAALADEYKRRGDKAKAWAHYKKAQQLGGSAAWVRRVEKDAEEVANVHTRFSHDSQGRLVEIEKKVTPPSQ